MVGKEREQEEESGGETVLHQKWSEKEREEKERKEREERERDERERKRVKGVMVGALTAVGVVAIAAGFFFFLSLFSLSFLLSSTPNPPPH